MNLSNMKLINFRNYSSTTFKFSKGANTIIGENDSGKSNALFALRMLLDDSLYYSTKSLKETDFNRSLGDYRGHWIIVSVEFENMSKEELDKEVIASLNQEMSNSEVAKGNVSLLIRPTIRKRQELFEASGNQIKFEQVKNTINLSDYEFLYRGKMETDFTNEKNYKDIVGDFENYRAPDPSDKQDNDQFIGTKIDIKDVNNHISVVFIDALRDVLRTISSNNNPIKKIVNEIENTIKETDFESVKNKIKDLNESITDIKEIGNVKNDLNGKLVDILGLVYSPELSLTSNISDELTSLSKFLNLKPQDEEGMTALGLGHLNMIFIALKIVEYNICNTREVLNIMLIEEPEAHIHHHIQRTLFQNLGLTDKATQVIMTTHSPNIAESSEISRMNIVKSFENKSIAMNPSKGLNKFGTDNLNLSIDLTKAIERYLDAKRSSILFSKGVLLVEGDAEEIIIPNIVKNSLGVSLDEIGVGIVNVGSTAFEYIASIFSTERINRRCAIVTDLDEQVVSKRVLVRNKIKDEIKEEIKDNKLYKKGAAKNGLERQKKLFELFDDNEWVSSFYGSTTFEIELAKVNEGKGLYSKVVESVYSQNPTIKDWKNRLGTPDSIEFESETIVTSDQVKYNAVLGLAETVGKGWLATIISENISLSKTRYEIPKYIIEALAFISSESIDEKVVNKMILNKTKGKIEVKSFLEENKNKTEFPSLYYFVSRWLEEQEI
ncbi:ATP-dependent nuclease [Vagococcus carniphilus]|uniref:ATP-dependent nuclease n=1 Tax=Vagococcus carniphilus TaxID=218144 RepID=UPI00288F22A7|nr:AAA family ATPase [Vagococcus carniphilus]MDT2864348.1 AAA family ATPase [Vagococcus carniphilus]